MKDESGKKTWNDPAMGALEQNRQLHEQNKSIRQNIEAQSPEKEQRRLQALPFISIRKEAVSGTDSNLSCIHLDSDGCVIDEEIMVGTVIAATFSNIGAGPAIGLELSGEQLGSISAGESITVSLSLPLVNYVFILSCQLRFIDREYRKYRQEVRLRHGDETYEILSITPPELEE